MSPLSITDPNDPGKDTPVPYEKDPVVKEDRSSNSNEQNKNVSTNGLLQTTPTQTDYVQQVSNAKKELPSANKPVKAATQQSLPQTGDESGHLFSSLGMLSLALSFLGLFVYRKKEDKE